MIPTLNRERQITNEEIVNVDRRRSSVYQNMLNGQRRDGQVPCSSRMDRLVNYNKYQQEEKSQITNEMAFVNNEDTCPTKTTMQYSEVKIEEEKTSLSVNNENVNYQINSKTKMLLVVYSLVVAVIMAFIIINTSVLASLSTSNSQKQAELATVTAEYNQIKDTYNQISSDEHVIKLAETEYNMVK